MTTRNQFMYEPRRKWHERQINVPLWFMVILAALVIGFGAMGWADGKDSVIVEVYRD